MFHVEYFSIASISTDFVQWGNRTGAFVLSKPRLLRSKIRRSRNLILQIHFLSIHSLYVSFKQKPHSLSLTPTVAKSFSIRNSVWNRSPSRLAHDPIRVTWRVSVISFMYVLYVYAVYMSVCLYMWMILLRSGALVVAERKRHQSCTQNFRDRRHSNALWLVLILIKTFDDRSIRRCLMCGSGSFKRVLILFWLFIIVNVSRRVDSVCSLVYRALFWTIAEYWLKTLKNVTCNRRNYICRKKAKKKLTLQYHCYFKTDPKDIQNSYYTY